MEEYKTEILDKIEELYKKYDEKIAKLCLVVM